MLSYKCAVFLLMVMCVEGFNNLSYIPRPAPKFNHQGITGLWYGWFRKPSGLWPTTRDDSNYNKMMWSNGNNILGFRTRFGKKQCNQVFGRIAFLSPPAVATYLEDGFGGWMSAKIVTVAADYNRFVIYWACGTSSLVGNKCLDPAIGIIGRTPWPDKSTIADINTVLMNTWGLTVGHLRRILQNGMCYGGPKKFLH